MNELVMETRPQLEIGDTPSKFQPILEEKESKFPWKVLLLSLFRLCLCFIYYNFAHSQMVVRTDGSTSSKRPFGRVRDHYKYSEINVMAAVILMDVNPDPWSHILSGIASVSLLTAIVINSLQEKGNAQKDKFTDGDPERNNRVNLVNVALVALALGWISMDLIENIPIGLSNVHTLFTNVSGVEALAYLMIFMASSLLQLFLLFDSVKFHNSLIKEGVNSTRDSRPVAAGELLNCD